MSFERLYLCEFPQPNYRLLLSAAKCQLANEKYDLTLPGTTSKYGEHIPRPDYLGQSSRNAANNRKRFSLGFDWREWKDAYDSYQRFSIEELEEEIKKLQHILGRKL